MASKLIQKSFDWSKLAGNLPRNIRSEMNAFRSRNESIKSNLSATRETTTPIDWKFYQNNIAASGYADKFKKEYEAYKIPYPTDTASTKIDALQKQMQSEIDGIIKESQQAVQRLDSELAKIKAEKSYEEMTIDEYLANHPQLKRQCEDDLRNFRYGY